MIIATWNIERFNKSIGKKQSIVDCLADINADILVLTETHESIDLGNAYSCFHTSKLQQPYYRIGERRVSIYTKYPIIQEIETFREDTAICLMLNTPLGDLAVYGTVIGVHGNRRDSFTSDLDEQLIDFIRITQLGNICIIGDLNMTFGDNYYYTKDGRKKLNDSFDRLHLNNLTASIPENIDHIAISDTLVGEKQLKIETWNKDKSLSDHIGIYLEIV